MSNIAAEFAIMIMSEMHSSQSAEIETTAYRP
jgi:hypothetical protein